MRQYIIPLSTMCPSPRFPNYNGQASSVPGFLRKDLNDEQLRYLLLSDMHSIFFPGKSMGKLAQVTMTRHPPFVSTCPNCCYSSSSSEMSFEMPFRAAQPCKGVCVQLRGNIMLTGLQFKTKEMVCVGGRRSSKGSYIYVATWKMVIFAIQELANTDLF